MGPRRRRGRDGRRRGRGAERIVRVGPEHVLVHGYDIALGLGVLYCLQATTDKEGG